MAEVGAWSECNSRPEFQCLYLQLRDLDGSSGLHSLSCLFPRPPQIRAEDVVEKNLWAGASASSAIHFDGLDNILAVLRGRKVVHLYPPHDIARLYPRERDVLPIESRVHSYHHADSSRFPLFGNTRRKSTTLRSGEALFIPAGWFHEVCTPEPTIAVNWWLSSFSSASLRPSMLYLSSDEVLSFMNSQEIKHDDRATAGMQVVRNEAGCNDGEAIGTQKPP